MSLDLTALRLMRHRERCLRLNKHVPRAAVDQKTAIMLDDFLAYFREFPDVKVVEPGPFTLWFVGFRHPKLTEEARSVFAALIKQTAVDVDPAIEQGFMERLAAASAVADLTTAIEKFHNGDEVDVLTVTRSVADEIEFTVDRKIKNPQVLDPIEDLLKDEENDAGFHWRLPEMNRILKPLCPGDAVIIAGRPDLGKTTFCADNLTHFAAQVDALYPGENRSIIWFNNEGPGKRIITRNFQAALRMSVGEMVELSKVSAKNAVHRNALREQYIEAIGGRGGTLRVFDIHDMWNHEVEDILRRYPPGMVLFDMVDNIKFGGEANNNGQRTDQLLEAMYQWARLMAVKYECPVLMTSQISADGDGVAYPTLPQLKDSKCLAPGTLVRMADGSARAVEDIRVGDQVMGVDSTPRKVLATGTGREAMYRVSGPAWSFDCNEGHNLTVVNPTSKRTAGLERGEIRRLSLREFMAHPSYMQRLAAVRVAVEYPEADLPMDPYLFGLWLGDGAQRGCSITTGDREIAEYLRGLPTFRSEYQQKSNCADFRFGPRSWLRSMGVWMNKHIPQVFKVSSVAQRRALLAGLMDSDGYVSRDGSSEICMSRKRVALLRDIQEVAQSLGFRTNWCEKGHNNSATLTIGVTEVLPCLLPRRRGATKDRHDTMKVTPLGVGVYHGITVDQDHRFVLANYIATENTGKQGTADLIITIGKVHDPMLENIRYLGTTKNKKGRSGMPKTLRLETVINGDKARFEVSE